MVSSCRCVVECRFILLLDIGRLSRVDRRDMLGLPGSETPPTQDFSLRILLINLGSSSLVLSLVCKTHFPRLMNTLTSNSKSMLGSWGLGCCWDLTPSTPLLVPAPELPFPPAFIR
uniref:Uncharacterized protein n=1 Tax=Cacopsylla melanoneura TaxID=428564 RepID=A0A8D8UAX5_9HEMI